MYSNLVKAEYKIQDMNLKELREIIVKENNLTSLDILKGFHEISNIQLRYPSFITEQNIKDIKLIQKECEDFLLQNNIVQKVYDEIFNSVLEEFKKEFVDFSLDYMKTYEDKNSNLSVDIKNQCFYFHRAISDTYKIKRKVKELLEEYISTWIKNNFGDKYKINKGEDSSMPCNLNLNKSIDIDFSNIYKSYDEKDSFSDWLKISYDSHINGNSVLNFAKYDIVDIVIHIEEFKAKEIFNDAINSVINQNNSIGELEYLQNLESQPITININSKTNKHELIDGYKRLLYITDENLLKYNAPIKIFSDLNDVQFLSLLYASNVWKDKEKFHDRGFLFALKTRFGFEIPSTAYNKSIVNELNTLQIYDFGGNLVNVRKNRIMNTLDTHEHLVSDMNMMYNYLESKTKDCKFDENISDEIKYAIIELVGELRREKGKYNQQKEVSKELIDSIYDDEFINKLCRKKHLSTRTYVMNYFRDKKIYKRIIDIIKNNLVDE